MKKQIFIFSVLLLLLSSAHRLSAQAIFPVTMADTLVFDLSEATCSGNNIEFPVYINSDDDIYAIDFAMQYDLTRMTYSSITVLKPYLNISINYNSGDSTLRFSCFSGVPIEKDIPLFSLRFNKQSATVDSIGFRNVDSYLNGDACSNVTHAYLARPVLIPAGPLNIYPGDSISLSVNALPGYSYEWSTGDTTTSILIGDDGIYEITATNQRGCSISSSIIINNGISLPVELSYFLAEIKNNDVALEWVTFSEGENDYFTIEKSADGKNWVNINETNGAGNSNEINRYVYIDKNPFDGMNYYRLFQTDYNGQQNYIASDAVLFGLKNDNSYQIYPNPFSDVLHFISHHDVVARIVDTNGMALTEEFTVPGESSYNFNTQHLAPGIYFLRIKDQNDVFTVKICRF